MRNAVNRRATLSLAVAGVVFTMSSSVQAANKFWDGDTDNLWTTGNNWGNPTGTAPTNGDFGDIAIFAGTPTANQPTLTASRGIQGVDFQSGGWSINGTGFTLTTRSINSPGNNTFNAGFQTIYGGTIFVGTGSTLTVNGVATHNGGGNNDGINSKTGEGTVRYNGGISVFNPLNPITTNAGITELNNTGTPGYFFVRNTGTVKLAKSNVIGEAAAHYFVVDNSGLLDMNGFSDTIGALYVGASNGTNLDSVPGNSIGGVGGGTVALNGGTLTARSVNLKGGTVTAVGGGTLNAQAGGVVTIADANTSTINSTFGLANSTAGAGVTFNVANGAAAIDLSLTGPIVNNVGTGKITKTGLGVFSVSGASTFTAGTTVSVGTLLVNNSPAVTTESGLGSGAVVVSGGATLGGTGRINGASANVTATGLDASTLAVINPGSIDGAGAPIIGTLSVGGSVANNVTLGDFSSLVIDFSSTGLTNDVLAVAGALSLSSSSVLSLNIPTELTLPSYTLATFSSLSGTFSSVSNLPEGYDLIIDADSIDLVQNAAVPEPASLAILGAGAMGLLLRRRNA